MWMVTAMCSAFAKSAHRSARLIPPAPPRLCLGGRDSLRTTASGSNGRMNFELVELEPIECEMYQTKEVLKILLHSIIFQRALGECRFSDAESDLLDVSYVRCDSRAISQRVEEHAEAFSGALERASDADAARRVGAQPASTGSASTSTESPRLQTRIAVSFVERRTTRAFGLFRSDEKVTWEKWLVSLSVRPPGQPARAEGVAGGGQSEAEARRQQQQVLAGELRVRLETILNTASSRKEHIPVHTLAHSGTCMTRAQLAPHHHCHHGYGCESRTHARPHLTCASAYCSLATNSTRVRAPCATLPADRWLGRRLHRLV